MNGPEAPYSIGSPLMPGLAKLVEEMAELSEVLAKFMGNGGDPEYFGRFNLDDRLEEEIADVEAALRFFKARQPARSRCLRAHTSPRRGQVHAVLSLALGSRARRPRASWLRVAHPPPPGPALARSTAARGRGSRWLTTATPRTSCATTRSCPR